MKTFLLTLKLIVLVIVFLFFTTKTFSQGCGTGTNNGQIMPTPNWQYVTAASGTYAYWSFTANVGSQYEFHNCNVIAEDTYLRIYNSTWTQLVTADDNCSMNAAITQTYYNRWTCHSSGTYYIYLTHYSCAALANNQRLDYWSDYNPYKNDAGVTAITSPTNPIPPGTANV